MAQQFLNEAFKELNLLSEDTFEVSPDGIAELKSFMDDDTKDQETDLTLVVDPDAETEDELKDSYVGKVILDCSICQSKLFKDPTEVTINEDETLANVGEECPYCHSSDGYTIIGEVAPYEEEVKDSEKIIDDETIISESDKPAALSIKDAQKWVDYDMKRYGKISKRTNDLVKKAGFQIIKDDHGDYEVAAGKYESMQERLNQTRKNVRKKLNEDFNKVEVETDTDRIKVETDGRKVNVTSEPRSDKLSTDTDEVIKAVDIDTQDKFNYEQDDTAQDVDIDEFSEEDFDELSEKYLKKVYENVDSYKTTSGKVKGNLLMLEGLITFKSGKKAKTNFVFESKSITKTGKLKFIGENKQFARGKKAFTLTGKMKKNKLIAESLTYNYTARDASTKTSKKLYGTVSK